MRADATPTAASTAPRADELPSDIRDLVYRDGVELTHARWDSDVAELVVALEPFLVGNADADPVDAAEDWKPPNASAAAAPGSQRAPVARIAAFAVMSIAALGALALYLADRRPSEAVTKRGTTGAPPPLPAPIPKTDQPITTTTRAATPALAWTASPQPPRAVPPPTAARDKPASAPASDGRADREPSSEVPVSGVDRIRRAAEGGSAPDQAALAMMLLQGSGGLTRNDKDAVAWLRKAADRGNALAQGRIGMMSALGRGELPKSERDAESWFRKAARQNDDFAQYNLGILYERGGVLAKSDKDAVDFHRKAADQGNAAARNNLGVMYEGGRGGLAKSDFHVVSWFRKAADQGSANGQRNSRACTRRVGVDCQRATRRRSAGIARPLRRVTPTRARRSNAWIEEHSERWN